MHQLLVNLVRDRLGRVAMMYVHARFDDYQETPRLMVECSPGRSPVFLRTVTPSDCLSGRGSPLSNLPEIRVRTNSDNVRAVIVLPTHFRAARSSFLFGEYPADASIVVAG